MTGLLRWEVPSQPRTTARSGRVSKWVPVIDALLEKPGEWAVIAEGESKYLNQQRIGLLAWAKKHDRHVLTAIRTVDDVSTLYALAHTSWDELLAAYQRWSMRFP